MKRGNYMHCETGLKDLRSDCCDTTDMCHDKKVLDCFREEFDCGKEKQVIKHQHIVKHCRDIINEYDVIHEYETNHYDVVKHRDVFKNYDHTSYKPNYCECGCEENCTCEADTYNRGNEYYPSHLRPRHHRPMRRRFW